MIETIPFTDLLMSVGAELLAQDGRLSDMGSHFRESDGATGAVGLVILAAAAGLVIVVVVTLNLYLRRREKHGYSSARGLFRELCAAHSLDRSQRAQLRSVARTAGLHDLALTFIEPGHLNAAIERETLDRAKTKLVILRDRLFQREQTPD